ncbi:cytoplasmic protein [Bacillus cereus]|nr:cytoplasmic protein [Bacillus cereus]
MDGLKELVHVVIHTNERDIEMTSIGDHICIRQSLDGEKSSVVVTKQELDMLALASNNDSLSRFMSSVFNMNKAM